MSVVRRAAAIVLAGVLGLAATGCTSGGDDEPRADPTPSATSLAEVAVDDLTVVRADFCPLVAPAAVEDALGAASDDSATWGNGDRVRVAEGVRDVVHEYGCSWTAGSSTARAWVFAPPVTATSARALGRATLRGEGCERVPGAAAFGAASVAVTCRVDGVTTTTYQGLFGDAWLSCSLTGTDPARADSWCATVAQAAAA